MSREDIRWRNRQRRVYAEIISEHEHKRAQLDRATRRVASHTEAQNVLRGEKAVA